MPQIKPLVWKRSCATPCSTCRPVWFCGTVTHCTEVAGVVSPTGAMPAAPKSMTTATRFCPAAGAADPGHSAS